ncbi:MAG: MlaE family ABC transporter permease [Bilophila wadsworthia]
MTKSRASASLGGALRAESSEGVLRVIFSGEWKRDLLGPNFFTERDEALRETERLLKEARSVELLGEALGEWDSGVLVVTTRLVTLAKEHNIPLDDARLPEGIRNLTKLALAVPRTPPRSVRPKDDLPRTGRRLYIGGAPHGTRHFRFYRRTCPQRRQAVPGPLFLHVGNVWLAVQESGVDALPIVSLISLLVGLILAFVGVIQLKMFGAEIYVSSLVAVSMTRIMGAIMTGIILAGRTGASYAAVIGTMQVNEEIDALTTLGVAPSDYLIMPRVLALTAMTPLLVLYSDFMGIMGGFIVGVGILGLDPMEYYTFTQKGFNINNLWVGMVHGAVYGMLIAITGCYQGLRCGRNAEAVGKATTSAVVYSIVGIVLSTAVLTILCNILNI